MRAVDLRLPGWHFSKFLHRTVIHYTCVCILHIPFQNKDRARVQWTNCFLSGLDSSPKAIEVCTVQPRQCLAFVFGIIIDKRCYSGRLINYDNIPGGRFHATVVLKHRQTTRLLRPGTMATIEMLCWDTGHAHASLTAIVGELSCTTEDVLDQPHLY